MKKIYFVAVIFTGFLVMVAATPAAMADMVGTVVVDRVPEYYTGGGEFTVYPSSGLQWLLPGYVPGVTSNLKAGGPNFQSFCLELNEGVDPYGHKYAAVVNDRAVYGGLSPQAGGDPISKGTAYLYHQFQNGQLTGYNYTGNRQSSAAALQGMIWYLEDEQSGYGNNNPFAAVLQTQFGNNWAIDAKLDNDGAYSAFVLNLWDVGGIGKYDYRHQDLLVCDPTPPPVPEPATMLLLGTGLLGLAGLARKKFRKK